MSKMSATGLSRPTWLHRPHWGTKYLLSHLCSVYREAHCGWLPYHKTKGHLCCGLNWDPVGQGAGAVLLAFGLEVLNHGWAQSRPNLKQGKEKKIMLNKTFLEMAEKDLEFLLWPVKAPSGLTCSWAQCKIPSLREHCWERNFCLN